MIYQYYFYIYTVTDYVDNQPHADWFPRYNKMYLSVISWLPYIPNISQQISGNFW